MIINHVYFCQLIRSGICAIWYQNDTKNIKREIGNGKWLGMTNYNIYLKHNFNRLVMNVTQINFFIDKMCIYDHNNKYEQK